MIQKNGHYILTVNDYVLICKHFGVNINTTTVKTVPQLQFTEYRFYDIYTNGLLFTFYDHDGMFRVAKTFTNFYEISVDQVLTKNPSMPPIEMQKAIKKNVHSAPTEIKRRIDNFKNDRTSNKK